MSVQVPGSRPVRDEGKCAPQSTTLRLADLKVDLELLARNQDDEAIVRRSANAYVRTLKVPQLNAVECGSLWYYADDLNLLRALERIKRKDAQFLVRQGDLIDVLELSIHSCQTMEMGRTPLRCGERRDVVTRMFRHKKYWTRPDREIARFVGSSHKTVGRIRRKLQLAEKLPKEIGFREAVRKGRRYAMRPRTTEKKAQPAGSFCREAEGSGHKRPYRLLCGPFEGSPAEDPAWLDMTLRALLAQGLVSWSRKRNGPWHALNLP